VIKPPQNPAGETGPRDEATTVKVEVNLVPVRVVVRDAKGNAVGGLRKEDFQLFDRGKPQEIKEFSVEEAAKAKTRADSPPLAGPVENSGTLFPSPSPDRYVAYLFDDIHMAFSDLTRVRDAAIRHLAALSPRDRAALFTTSGRGNVDFTDDRARLENALRQLQPRPITGGEVTDCPKISPYQADLMRSSGDCSGMGSSKETLKALPTDPTVRAATLETLSCRGGDQSRGSDIAIAEARTEACRVANQVLDADRHESRISLFVLQDAIRHLSGMSGQRSILLLSPGFYAAPMKYMYEELVDRALHAQVTISTLDGRGLYTLDTLGDVTVKGSQTPDTINQKAQVFQAAAAANEEILGRLAYGTGGSYFHGSNDFDQGFREIAAPPEYVYLLGFSPHNLKLDGKFHELSVTVTSSSKLTIQARKGYYATKQATGGAEQDKTELAREAKPLIRAANGGAPRVPGEVQPQPDKSSGAKAQLDWVALSRPQPQFVLCEDGQGGFETTFAGVTVAVGATKSGGFAQRSCAASLAWEGHELPVATEAAQVDIDVLGADLGLDVPVVAFQIKKSRDEPEMTYLIYSLSQPPQLLRTIGGGDFYRAEDADLSGRNVIWTRDVAAIRGFEGFSPGDFDYAPAVALRLERNRLRDASAEFPAYFDGQIATIRAGLSAQDIGDFRQWGPQQARFWLAGVEWGPQQARFWRAGAESDGRLAEAASSTAERTRRLRSTKVKVLEIVWAYLNSGRDEEAWGALADMWPPEDLARIRSAILYAQVRGLRSQIDSVSPDAPELNSKKKNQVRIYDVEQSLEQREIGPAVTAHAVGSQSTPGFYEANNGSSNRPKYAAVGDVHGFVDTTPKAILLLAPSPSSADKPPAEAQWTLELVIDAAGKVRSAKLQGGSGKELIEATRGWKFIPAFEKGKAVACRLRMDVAPER
jgi:VWFA-related protein